MCQASSTLGADNTSKRSGHDMTTLGTDVYYDPFDVDINVDPNPTFPSTMRGWESMPAILP